MQIIDGKKISNELYQGLKNEIQSLTTPPIFCDILVGEDSASVQYVNLKKKKATELGIKFFDANFTDSINTFELLQEIDRLNKLENMSGIIVQLPLPAHIDTKKVLDAIDARLDVDCLGETASQKFYAGDETLSPPTALACMKMLEGFELKDKEIVIIGEGKLVGRPVAQMLKNRGLDFQTINSQTANKDLIIKNADVIISGVGKGKFLNAQSVKDNVIIIDAGTSEEGGAIVGDTDFESVKAKASYITPVPGGVGPVTVAMLFSNVLKVAKQK